jgi:prolipoprotein diacylglyceryltransferase
MALEQRLRPTVQIAGRKVSTFQLCGVTGFLLGAAAAMALGARVGLPPALVGALAAAAAVTFLGLAWLTLVLSGSERLVYYHHELAVLAVSAAVLAIARRPMLRGLDVVILALGVFLGFGRIGCFSVGCCYGRPHRLGVRYGWPHAHAGFPRALVGVPLLPVQAIESLVVLALTAIAAARLAAGAPPGATLATQLVAYALLRFTLELGRGDAARPALARMSEAQWLSLAIALAVIAAERARVLPPSSWHPWAAAALALAFTTVALARGRSGALYRMLAPRHVEEIAELLADGASRPAREVQVHTTSLGVKLSSCVIDEPRGPARLYTISGVDRRTAGALSSLIQRLRPADGAARLLERRPGLYQLVVSATDR